MGGHMDLGGWGGQMSEKVRNAFFRALKLENRRSFLELLMCYLHVS